MKKIAVLIPCYNEELTVKKVVEDFKKELPEADIYVYNNNSKDRTEELAKEAGAIVRNEYAQGKGNVVRSMFRDIDADCYVLVDGDDTYPADEVHKLIAPVLEGKADMVIGDRLSNGTYAKENKRGFHNFGNNLVRFLVNFFYNAKINDIMTGYRVYSKDFVKAWPVVSNGFQIETEMTIFSLVFGMKLVEIPIIYRDRPAGSFSKLNTIRDGFRVIMTIYNSLKQYKPLLLYSIMSVFFALLGVCFGAGQFGVYNAAKAFSNITLVVISAILFGIAVALLACGIVLDGVFKHAKFQYVGRINDLSERK